MNMGIIKDLLRQLVREVEAVRLEIAEVKEMLQEPVITTNIHVEPQVERVEVKKKA